MCQDLQIIFSDDCSGQSLPGCQAERGEYRGDMDKLGGHGDDH